MVKTSDASPTSAFFDALKNAKLTIIAFTVLFGLGGLFIPGVFKYQVKVIINVGYIGELPFESSQVLLNKLKDTKVFKNKFKGENVYVSVDNGPAPNTLLLRAKADSAEIVDAIADEALSFLNQEYSRKYQTYSENLKEQSKIIDKAIAGNLLKKGFPAEVSIMELERQKYILNARLASPFETYPNALAYKSEMKESSISLIRFAYVSFSVVMGGFIGATLAVFLAAARKTNNTPV